MENIDYVFGMKGIFDFGTSESELYHQQLYQKIKPTHILTCVLTDIYWQAKRDRAKMYGITFIGQKEQRWGSTSEIIEKLKGFV